MQRIRIVIEIDTLEDRKTVNAEAYRLTAQWRATGELVYLATEIAPNQETQQRNIMDEKG